MFYKNISCSVKTFYGVEFKPGQIQEVPGYINSSGMIVVDGPAAESVKQSKPSSEKTKKNSEKAEVIPEARSEEKSQIKDSDNEVQSSKT